MIFHKKLTEMDKSIYKEDEKCTKKKLNRVSRVCVVIVVAAICNIIKECYFAFALVVEEI